MKHTNLIFILFSLITVCCLTSCADEGVVFIGEWQDARTPENVWKIKKEGSVYKGIRLSGTDAYEYDTEEWTFQIGQAGHPTLVPVNDGGSRIMFQAQQNRMLRNPPGRAYVKIIKEK